MKWLKKHLIVVMWLGALAISHGWVHGLRSFYTIHGWVFCCFVAGGFC